MLFRSQGNSLSQTRTPDSPPSNTCHPSLSSPSSPSTPPITHPWEPRTPSSTAPSTRPAGPCPSSGHHAINAKLSSEVAEHPAGEGAGPGCARPSPQLRAPRIWHCPPGTAGRGAPSPGSAQRRLPSSPASFSPSQISGKAFPAPGSPLASAHRPEPKGPPGPRGVNAKRTSSVLKGPWREVEEGEGGPRWLRP